MTGDGGRRGGRVKLLQAGLGGWGRDWARSVLPEVPEVEPVGWIDVSERSLQLAQEQANVPLNRCFAALPDALAACDAGRPDALLVTTDLPHHADAVREALKAGLHVLVEKPFAPTVAEARGLVELAERCGRVLMVSQNYRFHAVVREVAALVRSAKLGRVDEVEIDFRRSSEPVDGVRRRHHLEEQPLLVDMSIHHFDLLRLVLSTEAERVYCRTWRPGWCAFSGPPAGAAIIEFEGGAIVSYRGSWISRGQATPWSGDWRLQCERGEILWSGRGDRGARQERLLVRRRPRGGADPSTVSEQLYELAPLRYPDRAGALHEFADAILCDRSPETSGEDNLKSLELMEAAVASSVAGTPVQV